MSLKVALAASLPSLWLLLVVASAEQECDRSQCKGPTRFYEDLRCKPIYENPADCCAVAYDCSHLNGRSADKCYANGHEYSIGERLRDEDIVNPCDKIGCFCSQGPRGLARFSCPLVNCILKEAKPGCYLRGKLGVCCGQEEICPEKPEDRPKCQVDGQTYLEGEGFIPNDEPNLACQCLEGYEGKNVHPFCRETPCGTEQKHSFEIRENCAPVYRLEQRPTKNCNNYFRCQKVNDAVVHPLDEDINESELLEHEWCKFGNLTLHVGDQLTRGTSFLEECVECKCEVPPTLTCRQLPEEQCMIKFAHGIA
ncbi:kielin/chordin-like protein [Nasonia vitripennis]|uniref:Uncharacterized protein n=1 Tax=Nasonia vitripennis TaxID=7425 RepID=A0A7M7G4W2_NASVI|nr:kielin/chordin-like protein [Nasonia vitripennis]